MNEQAIMQGSTPPIFVDRERMAKIFADGLSQLMLGYPVSRFVLHDLVERNVADPSAPELRHVVCEIVMPTAGLIDMAKSILAAAKQAAPAVLQVQAEYTARMHAAFDTIDMNDPPSGGGASPDR